MTNEPHGRSEANALWQGLKAEHARYLAAISYIPTSASKLQEDLRRYLCLRCAGFLEQVTYVILDEYLSQKSSSPVLDFSRSYFQRAPNLRYQPYVDLVGRFGSAHKLAFETMLAGLRKSLLTDLLEVRNDVAHGKYHGGRKLDPTPYIALCEEIYDWLVEHFLADSIEIVADDGKTRIGTGTAATP